ncbi:MAG: glycosyltransferase family 4 protein [Sulfurimonas sp.]|nr:glycosyltransferase family 4 protein [Sulfurimonas sp.]
MRNVLYIVPSDYDSLEKKGVLNLILERDEGAFFDNILTLHPFTKNNKTIDLRDNNRVVEYGWKSKITFLNKFLVTKVFGTLTILFKLAFIFKQKKISIIRATDPYYMGLIGLYYSKLFNIPLLVSIHSDYDKRYELDKNGSFTILGSRMLAKKLEKFILKKCDLIIPIRKHMKKDIINEYNIDENKIKIFPHGIDFKKILNVKEMDIHKMFDLDKTKKIISFVGRVTKENYIDDIIYIVKKLSIMRSDFIFLIVGDGKDLEYMKNLVNNNNLDNCVKFIGFQDHNVVINVRKQSTVSLCLMAGFSLIEACACARPVISYDVEWHHELVKSAQTGFLVKEHDVDDVVSKLIFLLDNPELSGEYGKNAYLLANKAHNITNTTKIKQEIYLGVING